MVILFFGSHMHAQLRRLIDIDRRTEAAWADLAARAVEPNPFFEPVFVLPFARYLGLDVALMTVEHGADMVVCLPLFSGTLGWHGLPLPAWKTWNPLSTPLVHAGDAEAALASAFAHFSSLRGPRLLVLEYLTTDGPVAAALEAATVGRRQVWPSKALAPTESVRPALRRREDGTYLVTTLRGKHKHKLAQKRRFLERLVGELLTVVDKAGDTDAVEQLLSMEVGGWKGRIGSAVACNPRRAGFFREMCAGFAEQGRLQLLSLKAADTTLAMKCNLRSGGTSFALRRAYDERFTKGSPGAQLEIDAVQVFHASGDRFSDSCGNSTRDPEFWLWPDKRPLTRFVVTLGG